MVDPSLLTTVKMEKAVQDVVVSGSDDDDEQTRWGPPPPPPLQVPPPKSDIELLSNEMDFMNELIMSLTRRVQLLERTQVETNSVRGIWPEYIFINGHKIPCNTRSKDDGLTPLERARNTCKKLVECGLRPSYKALRSCHYGSVISRKVLDEYNAGDSKVDGASSEIFTEPVTLPTRSSSSSNSPRKRLRYDDNPNFIPLPPKLTRQNAYCATV